MPEDMRGILIYLFVLFTINLSGQINKDAFYSIKKHGLTPFYMPEDGTVIGSPYLSKNFMLGYLKTEFDSINYYFRYNIYQKQMEITNGKDTTAITKPFKVKVINFSAKNFIYELKLSKEAGRYFVNADYFEILYDGDFKLLLNRSKILSENSYVRNYMGGGGDGRMKYNSLNSYYAMNSDGEIKKYTQRKSVFMNDLDVINTNPGQFDKKVSRKLTKFLNESKEPEKSKQVKIPKTVNRPTIANLGMGVENNRIKISYDLYAPSNDSAINVHLFFTDKTMSKKLEPSLVFGDIGENIRPGLNKSIIWDIKNDDIDLRLPITPRIYLNDDLYKLHKGGPSNAFLSLAVPGLGDYFVADIKEMKIKPYVKTLASIGFFALGTYANNNRKIEKIFHPDTYVYNNRKRTWEFVPAHYTDGRKLCWAFFGDAELFYGLGASIWVGDIIWVFNRGAKNKKFVK